MCLIHCVGQKRQCHFTFLCSFFLMLLVRVWYGGIHSSTWPSVGLMPSSQIGFSLLLVKLARDPWVSSMFCVLLVSSPYPRLCPMAITPRHRSLMMDSPCVRTGCLRKLILSCLLALPLLYVAILQVSWKRETKFFPVLPYKTPSQACFLFFSSTTKTQVKMWQRKENWETCFTLSCC